MIWIWQVELEPVFMEAGYSEDPDNTTVLEDVAISHESAASPSDAGEGEPEVQRSRGAVESEPASRGQGEMATDG